MTRKLSIVFSLFLAIGILAPVGIAQTTGFIYQGSLNSGGVVANGNHDFEFRLFNALSGGTQLGLESLQNGVAVTNGIFAVSLDFGSQFPGAVRFLEIRVRPSGGGVFTPLAPRQQVSSSPYSVQSLNATNATNATSFTGNLSGDVSGVQGSTIVNAVGGQPAASVAGATQAVNTATSANTPNTLVRRDASGNVSASIISATQYNTGGSRILSGAGNNLFAGAGAGFDNTTGQQNSFFGFISGRYTTTGSNNSFFGLGSGSQNTLGGGNAFFGGNAGETNTTGDNNTIIGTLANVGSVNLSYSTAIGAGAVVSTSNTIVLGRATDTVSIPGMQINLGGSRVLSVAGTNNLFAGVSAGTNNTTGSDNSFVGASAGSSNTTGISNSFVGFHAGLSNTTGNFNSFVGWSAGQTNTTGNFNSFFGHSAGSNNTTGSNNSFVGVSAGQLNTTGIFNSFVGVRAGGANTTGISNSFVGFHAGLSNTTGDNNTIIGDSADVGSGNLSFATAIGASAVVSASNTVVLGRAADIVRVPGSFASVGQITTNGNLVVLGTSLFAGVVDLSTLGVAGAQAICRNGSGHISTCSSSLRYKTDVNMFFGGLDVVRRLRPITFNWKDGGMHDLGLGAEDVEAIEPLLVTYNKSGQVEGVKYDRIGVVLVNAVKEQQTEIGELRAVSSEQARKIEDQSSKIKDQNSKIEDQSSKIKAQQKQIDALTRLVCASNKDADICKEQ